MRHRINLCGEYQMLCAEHQAVRRWSALPATLTAMRYSEGILLSGKVPGNFELDLYRAGIIEDPFYGTNVWKMQKLESMHIFYGRAFSFHGREDTEPFLVLEGVDTVAEIYLNGEKIADCQNMFLIHRIPLPNLREGENELLVHILPACITARNYPLSAGHSALKYNYEALRLRKSASMFGWDIMPRIVSAGLWRPVYLEYCPAESIRQAYLMTLSIDKKNRTACLQLFYETVIEADDLADYRIRVKGRHGKSSFTQEDRLWFTAGKMDFTIDHVDFWEPRGHGEACVYEVEAALFRNDRLIDSREFGFGVRTVELERENGNFRFRVNGEDIFLLGTNFVPVDAFHSRDRERLPKVMELLRESGCNALRIWGGGVYEDDWLYEACDRMGILIWQDFMMACGMYPADASFCDVIWEEAIHIIRRLRQHPSLLLWAGDNECDQSVLFSGYGKDPNTNEITRKILRDAVCSEDPVRPYLPSSPYYGEHWQDPPEDHLWGPRDYYKSPYYRNSSCLFASEIGYHGCPARKSIEKFIPPHALWPWQDNDSWLAHASSPEQDPEGSFAYRIGLMAAQVQTLFGTIPDNLDDFILASQISQAEAVKYFIELFRLNEKRTGIIWWNLIDGWPQFSDAVVDYYYEKKLAFYYIREIQQPLIVSIRETAGRELELTVCNSTPFPQTVRITLTDYTKGQILWEGALPADIGLTSALRLEYRPTEPKIYVIEWKWNQKNGLTHYLAGEPPFSLDMYRTFLEEVYTDIIPIPFLSLPPQNGCESAASIVK